MAYIREKESEYTGFQNQAPYCDEIDCQCDFAMVYGLDDTTPARIAAYRDNGYVVHLMTGIAWGAYLDYLSGQYDGREHWDESQMDRNGIEVLHNPGDRTIPYMVPTISYSDYLTEKIKPAIDAGAEAVHLEEPEYWGFGGHAEAFKREYEFYYNKKWSYVEENVDTIFKASKVMAYLYKRTVDRICSSLKEYAMVKYGRRVRFYIPTHSLISYTQIHMVSPESLLMDLPSVDGYIAQIWTGTSRMPNEYEGVVKERTFEAGFLEYGIMQELVKGSDKRMWFLHDPVEDNPEHEWDDYEYNYVKTVVASLFQPLIHHYEIAPWPSRVFCGQYPQRNPDVLPQPIPAHYATKLCNMINMLGDMDQDVYSFVGKTPEVGMLIADSAMYQRSMPDDLKKDPINDKASSFLMPDFFGLTLPLLKHGVPVRPLQLDNIRRFPGYLDDYKTIMLTYEFFKPESPDINVSIANWVGSGGVLVYFGDGSDPFHQISHWWNASGYATPAEHLFEAMGLDKKAADGLYSFRNGLVMVVNQRPARLSQTVEGSQLVRDAVRQAMEAKGYVWEEKNHFMMDRGPYVVVACMNESVSSEPVRRSGCFVEMTDAALPLLDEIVVEPDQNKIYFDLDKVKDQKSAIIGTTLRLYQCDITDSEAVIRGRGAKGVQAVLRLKLPFAPSCVKVTDHAGKAVENTFAWDEASSTVLVQFFNEGLETDIHIA